MTDRINHITVVLDANYRVDDVETLLNAIRQMRQVAAVEVGTPTDMRDLVFRSQQGVKTYERVEAVLREELLPRAGG